MKITTSLFLGIGCAFALALSSQAQNLVVNGSFETPQVTQAAWYSQFPATNLWPWQTHETTIEVWTNGMLDRLEVLTNATYSADGGQNMEILSDAKANTVWQTVPTITGEWYRFSFYHTPRGGYNSHLTVSVNSYVVAAIQENGGVLTNFLWNQFATNFIADSNLTTLAFADVDSVHPAAGTHIDGVVLEHIPQLAIQQTPDSTLSGCWFGVSNEVYQLQYSTDLNSTNWADVGDAVRGSNTTNSFSDYITNAPQAFYRVRVGP